MLSHHAQLIEGSSGHIAHVLDILAETYGLHAKHPDLTVRTFEHEKLGVDDAHTIHEILIKKPAQANWNVVVVYAHTLTEQAQNALLKILEEPPVHTRFILITDSIHPLLPTLRSRLNLFNLADTGVNFDSVPVSDKLSTSVSTSTKDSSIVLLDAKSFLDAEIATRLEIVKKIHTDLDKEKINIAQVFHFVNKIEEIVHTEIEQGQKKGKDKVRLAALVKAQTYIHAPGNSVKMLLEYLAIIL